MIKTRRVYWRALALVLVLAAGPASAQAPADQPGAIKSKADEAFDARRFADALANYRLALQKNRDPRLHYNIAQSLSALERYPEALAAYQAFLSEAPAGTLNDTQQAKLFALMEELKRKVARIEITCDVPGARLFVGGRAVGVAPLAEPVVVNAGETKVEALAEGHKPYEAVVPLVGGGARVLAIRLERVDFTGAIAVSSNVAGAQVVVDGIPRGATPTELKLPRGAHVVVVKAPQHVAQSRTTTVEPGKRQELVIRLERAPDYTLAYVGFGIGGAGLIAGTVTGALAFSTFGKAKEQCDQVAKECGPAGQSDLRDSKSWGLLSTLAFGVGMGGVALGTYGLMTARPKQESAPPATPSVAVRVMPGGVGVGGTF